MAEAVTQQVGATRPAPRPLVVWWPPSPSPSRLLAPWVFWWNRIFAIFSWIFTESWISAQKRDTRAILLKTALVRVSCIQNTQIRGETIAKVFGKVDTFWTYHKGAGQTIVILKKVTPPWYVKVGGHPMESVSHGLRKEKVGSSAKLKEHKCAN
jgi:hypothetical protein